jgi:hypothetical protein
MRSRNALRWDGSPGHYEVHYLTMTDPATGTGLWIRSTILAPTAGDATCSLWFIATTRDGPPVARKATFPIDRLQASAEPFSLCIAGAELTDRGYRGAFEDVAWDLRWEPGRGYDHVDPLLRRAKLATTVLTLPHGDIAIEGTVTLPGGELRLDGVHGGQAHLWGSKHSSRWAWAHCGDLQTPDGEPAPDAFLDGVSVIVNRFGREIGPSTPVVGRLFGRDFLATSPLRVARAPSRFALTSWTFEARDGDRRVLGEVDAPRASLAGVTYTDPDGDRAYCYNSEVASMRLAVFDGDRFEGTLSSHGRAHFEYAQREPIPDLPVHLT